MFELRLAKIPGRCPVKYCRSEKGKKKAYCNKHHQQLWYSTHPERAAFWGLRHRAERRKIVFTLTFEEFMEVAAKGGYIEGKGYYKHCLHMDRIDAEKGYEAGNIQVLTCSENAAKDNRRNHLPAAVRKILEEKEAREREQITESTDAAEQKAIEDATERFLSYI